MLSPLNQEIVTNTGERLVMRTEDCEGLVDVLTAAAVGVGGVAVGSGGNVA